MVDKTFTSDAVLKKSDNDKTFTIDSLIGLGSKGNTSIYINDSGTWKEFVNYEYFKVVKKQNQVREFEIKIMDLGTTEKSYVKEFAEVMFFSETNLILKGRIQKISYETAYECTAIGFGMEVKLSEKELIKSNDKRVQYTNTSAQTIANEILSSNTDGSSPWIITPNTTGLFDTDYGDISIRYEYGNRLNSIVKLAEAIDYEWSVTQDSNFVDFFDLAPLLPTSTRATVSQETFLITGANANCYQTFKETDITNLANKIDALGYGDGINQKHTSTYNASTTYSTLASDITDSSATITLVDASDFSTSGEIRIAEERITYTGKTGNDLTGCTRGTSSTTALAHKKNVYTEKYVAIASAEAGSSIGTNGLMDYTITEKDILNMDTLELIASRKLLERMDPIIRIKVMPNEPLETAGSRKIGDLITITDAESDISDDYRIVGINYISDYGDLSLEIEASNKSLTFIEQMQKQREATENLSKYMQGATNIYAISEAENCGSGDYLNMRFFLPSESIAINKIKLNFKLKDYRAYHTANVNESTHTHGIPSLTVNATTAAGGGDHNHGNISASGSHTHSVGAGGENYYYQYDETFSTGSWNQRGSVNTGGASFIGHVLWASVRLNSGIHMTTKIRLYNSTTGDYFPDANGITIGKAQYSSGAQPSICSGYLFVPESWTNNTYYFQIYVDPGGYTEEVVYSFMGIGAATSASTNHTHTITSSGTHTHSVTGTTTQSSTSDTGSAHTHGITYGIQEEALTNPSVDIYIGEDGGSMTQFNGSYTSDQINLDITSLVSAVGAGKWINIQFRPNKNMRIEANAYVQIFIESK